MTAAGIWAALRSPLTRWAAVGLVIGGLWLWKDIVGGQRDDALAEAQRQSEARGRAEEAARQSAAAVKALHTEFDRRMAEVAKLIQQDGQRTRDQAATVEALRRDPTHDAAAAAVLELSIERLRRSRGGRPGGGDPAGDGPGGDPGLSPAPAP